MVGREVRRDSNGGWWRKCSDLPVVEKRPRLQWMAEGLGRMSSPGLSPPFRPHARGCAWCLGSFLGYFFGPSLTLLKYLLSGWSHCLPDFRCLAEPLNFLFLMVLADCNWSHREPNNTTEAVLPVLSLCSCRTTWNGFIFFFLHRKWANMKVVISHLTRSVFSTAMRSQTRIGSRYLECSLKTYKPWRTTSTRRKTSQCYACSFSLVGLSGLKYSLGREPGRRSVTPLSHKFSPCPSPYDPPTAFRNNATSRSKTATVDI